MNLIQKQSVIGIVAVLIQDNAGRVLLAPLTHNSVLPLALNFIPARD